MGTRLLGVILIAIVGRSASARPGFIFVIEQPRLRARTATPDAAPPDVRALENEGRQLLAQLRARAWQRRIDRSEDPEIARASKELAALERRTALRLRAELTRPQDPELRAWTRLRLAMLEHAACAEAFVARTERDPMDAEPRPCVRALTELAAFAREDPRSSYADEALTLRAYLEADTGQYAGARQTYAQLFADWPASPQLPHALFRAAELAFDTADLVAAHALYERVVQAGTQVEQRYARYRLAICEQRLGQPLRALATLQALIDEPTFVEPELRWEAVLALEELRADLRAPARR